MVGYFEAGYIKARYLRDVLLFVCLVLPLASHADQFSDAVTTLNADSFTEKEQAIYALVALGDERSTPVLKAMLEGKLHYARESGELLYEREENRETVYETVFGGEPFVVESRRDASKIRTNNNLRRQLRTAIAGLELGSEAVEVRLKAARNLVNNSSEDLTQTIRDAMAIEDDKKVQEYLSTALALVDINSSDHELRLSSIERLGNSLESEALAALMPLVRADDDGNFAEENQDIRDAAALAIKKIEGKLAFYGTVENVFFGLSLGSVLLLAAVGLAITFGVMGVINMAHGEMIMLGAYTTYVVQLLMPNLIEASLIVAIPAAFLVAGAMGVLIERLVIRHLYGRPLETLLATFGISLILQQAVRSIFTPLNRQVITPDWMSGSFEINGALSLTFNRFYIIWFSLLVVIALVWLTRQTFFGLQMRAVTQNRAMANSMGIRSGWVDAMTFGLGSGIAGIAGVALSQLTNVGPNLGQAYIIDSFMVVVFGGVGNLFGTVFAAMSLGVVNKFLEPFAGAVLGKIIVLVFIILFIQWRPRGMFALKGRAAED
ncbi:MAG: urea ABC transporter permease subunit UrtB [Cellvibrionaceae bacterium]